MTAQDSMRGHRRLFRSPGERLPAVLSAPLILVGVLLLGWGSAAQAQGVQVQGVQAQGVQVQGAEVQEVQPPSVESPAGERSGCGGCAGMADQKMAGSGKACGMGGGKMAGHAMKGSGQGQRCCEGSGAERSMGGGMACKGMGAMGSTTADASPGAAKGGCGGDCPMHNAMSLVHQRSGIERRVEEIDGGIRSVTTAENPATADLIEHHVRQVAGLLEKGGRMRGWDPLFSEIFDHYDQIEISIERIDNGVVVEEISADPWVAELIRAHAAKVNDFLARGPAAVHEATPLPERPAGSER